MKEYQSFLRQIQESGTHKPDRTGTGTKSLFGMRMSFDLRYGFPILTTKKVHFKSVVAELLWFLSGSTNVRDLQAMGCTIWDEWANPETGDLGRVYGAQWRSWAGADGSVTDQISGVIEEIKKNPDSRRLIVSAWNVAELPSMALPPCHALFQFYTREMTAEELEYEARSRGLWVRGESVLEILEMDVPTRILECQLYQRSADAFLGVPFNIASYALLMHLVAHHTGLAAGKFYWVGGDCHIYDNHTEQVRTLLERTPRYPLPSLDIKQSASTIFDHELDDFSLIGYKPYAAIPAQVAV